MRCGISLEPVGEVVDDEEEEKEEEVPELVLVLGLVFVLVLFDLWFKHARVSASVPPAKTHRPLGPPFGGDAGVKKGDEVTEALREPAM